MTAESTYMVPRIKAVLGIQSIYISLLSGIIFFLETNYKSVCLVALFFSEKPVDLSQ